MRNGGDFGFIYFRKNFKEIGVPDSKASVGAK